ncbi:MAG: Aspartyl-tRNA(Asn) amidotransferase subunit Glutamyl-tRNA(Gln) amidotransferase subunit [Frankiales bacterium]|nr:Aspartyl-tRNA(Asn) amidotransferase subunit Glutamyl-tRNA(Gln) amidotransferase subunit [Frankiales bacterium]
MANAPPNELSAVAAAREIAAGRLTCEALARACLERVEARETDVRAFSALDADAVLATARQLDRQPFHGPLHGLPIGIKDVLDTSDLPTQMGSSIYEGYRTRADSAVVAASRVAGGVIFGKTVTCEFAGMAPRGTRNPHDLARTPGGSSSGSAAAVADFMLPLAFGTQTGGSILRPASFCGILGYKPTYGTFSRQGLKFAAESLDTIGLFAREIEDVVLFADALLGSRTPDTTTLTRPRIGLCRTYLWEAKASPETRAAVEQAARLAEDAGAIVTEFDLPSGFADLSVAREVINDVERSRSLAWEWLQHRGDISPQLTRSVESGLKTDQETYVRHLRRAEELRAQFAELTASLDGLVAPAVNGEAPLGLDYAGDPALQGLWTLLHVPTLALPASRGPNRMPVAIQVVGRRDEDRKMLALAIWLRDKAGIRPPDIPNSSSTRRIALHDSME